ncbi:MAG: VIT domain-containing protein [Anaerolineae bacterium]|jgi:Ca-activated chloride channel family protein
MNGKRIPALSGILVLLALLLSPTVPVLADGIVIPIPPPDVPIVEVPYLTIKYHRVTVTIEDQVATTRVDQVFVNESRFEVEGTYIFPLPEEATISEFAMWVDGEKLDGQVLERDEARRIYEDIVRSRRDPALLEYVGRDAFQASIYPIPPRGERRIELEYSQVLEMDNGLVEYVYPLNTEKFSPRPLEEVVVNVTIRSKEPLKAIYSPSHKVDIVRRGDHNAVVGYEEVGVRPDRDFVLYYTVSPEDVGLNLLSYKPDRRGDGFFLMLAAPKVELDSQQVIAKDVILVLDVSGSMRGEKIEQAKEALNYVLDDLHDEDRFNIIAFSTSTRAYARDLVPADERWEAQDFVTRLEATGSTDINRALLEALDLAGGNGGAGERPAIIIFLTDGLPTVGEVDIDRIIDNVGDAAPRNARIFPFGVGYDVNTALLDTVAENHRGASGYVRPEESIDEKVSAFYAKVSTPLLADLEIDFGRVEVEDLYPYPLPDLFAGTQLVVLGRYRDGGDTEITLQGEVNGQPQTYRYDDVRFEREGGQEFIARLWATRKIGYLLQQIRLHGEQGELVDEIVELSIRYGIITPYTSFLVEETEMALREEGRAQIVETVVETVEVEREVPMSGEAAVDRSVQEKALSQAVAPALAPTMAPGVAGVTTDEYGNRIDPVRYVGDKTFVLHKDVWTDTAYDPDRMTTVPVSFGSDDYFALVAARPEWGRYFALGDHVIAVLEGTAYEVREGEAPPLDVPEAAEPATEKPPTEQPPAEQSPDPQPEADAPGNALESFWQAIADLVNDFIKSFAR